MAFRRRFTAWDDIERFETIEFRRSIGGPYKWTPDYKTERVQWVLKSGEAHMLTGKFGFWPAPLCAFLNDRLAEFRAAYGNTPPPPVEPSPQRFDLSDWVIQANPVKLVLLGIGACFLGGVAFFLIVFSYAGIRYWLETQPPLFG